jgi:nucleoredoxin
MANAIIGSKILKESQIVPPSEVSGYTVIGLYFCAYWCPPCRVFTPDLQKAYEEIQNQHSRGFEIVYVSGDRDEETFTNFYETMPWTAIPWSEQAKKEELNARFEIEGMPSLIIIDGDGNLKSKEGRDQIIELGPIEAFRRWAD